MRHFHFAGPACVAGAIVIAVAACASSSPGSGAAPSGPATLAQPPSHSAAPRASQSQLGVPLPPAPSATGPLHVVLRDALPVTGSAAGPVPPVVISAEAPDGSVFATFGSPQGSVIATAPGSAVYVVDADQAAQVAEHPAIPVTALAADDTYLYAGGGDQIISYDRATGAVARTWSVAQPVRLLAASAGRLWAVLGTLAGGEIVEITPGSGGMRTVGTDAANVASIAAGPRGIYYVESGGATIVHIRPNGTRQQAPTNQSVNLQLSGPGAIQAISVIGDQVLLVHNAGQGLDSSSQTYDAATLAGPQANAPGTAGSNHVIGSLAGPVDLVIGTNPTGSNEVGRYNLSTGAVTDAVSFPSDTRGLGPLLGPYPAVFVFPKGGRAYLDRIG